MSLVVTRKDSEAVGGDSEKTRMPFVVSLKAATGDPNSPAPCGSETLSGDWDIGSVGPDIRVIRRTSPRESPVTRTSVVVTRISGFGDSDTLFW